MLSVEPPEIFRGFGVPILAPVAGTVVLTHDGEADHVARRSTPAQIPYAFGQVARVRAGAAAVAGNHVVLGLGPAGPYVLLAHLRRGTVRVAARRRAASSSVRPVGECGNSGNSTEPHVHLQATDSVAWETARRSAHRLPPTVRRRDLGAGRGRGRRRRLSRTAGWG